MKVVITTEINVDREAWAAEYGVEDTAVAIRADVWEHFANMMYAGYEPMNSGCVSSTTVRR